MSIGPPAGVKSEVAHAFTAHSTIGETAVGKVFIDRRRMWETEHWETIVGRARRAEDLGRRTPARSALPETESLR